ncbi:translation initiation factor IF-2-like [Canis lupus familiaris]|uniref:translation initiation factor IF-2-like n=1 Tax=Canis lupus familiaris TaxID=9615 RepID=UPI0018F3D154|nr:translation initiation factor IF-2-like [Canis lupus familiaris]
MVAEDEAFAWGAGGTAKPVPPPPRASTTSKCGGRPNGPAAGRARRRRGRARGCRGRRRLLLARSPARPPAAPRFSLRLPGPAHLRAPGRGPSCPGRCPGLQRGCRRGPRARAGVAQQRKARRGVGAARPGAPGRGTWEPPRRAPAISARPERAARGWPRVESAGNGARGSGPPTVDYLVCISRAQTTPTPATSSASWACFLPPGSRGAYLADVTGPNACRGQVGDIKERSWANGDINKRKEKENLEDRTLRAKRSNFPCLLIHIRAGRRRKREWSAFKDRDHLMCHFLK